MWCLRPLSASPGRRRPRLAAVVAVAVVGAAMGVFAQAPDRSKPPVVGPAPAVTLPTMDKRQLSNGLPVWIVEQHEVPVAQINLVVRHGSLQDPPSKFGVGSMAAAMMMEGAGTRSSLELADAVDFLGADLGVAITLDAWAVRLHVPVWRLGDALPLMADVALRPTFPADELERLRQQRLTSLVQAKDDAATIAAVAFSRVLYGTARAGTPSMGTATSIRSFAVDDLRAIYRRAFRADAATLIVVGDVSADTVLPQLEQAFGGWTREPGGPLAPAPAATPASRTRREVFLIDKPGAPQSQIRIGQVGVSRQTPDYFPITVMNTVLGGSFSSRLNMNLREEHGYTYGASSSFDMRADAGPFVAAAGVQTDKTSESLTEFFKELNAIRETVPADELARSKNYVALRYPGGFETTGDISRRLEDMVVYALRDDYFARYVPAIDAVSAGAVAEAAQKYGDRQAIEPGIKALNLGPLTVMTVDDVFGR